MATKGLNLKRRDYRGGAEGRRTFYRFLCVLRAFSVPSAVKKTETGKSKVEIVK